MRAFWIVVLGLAVLVHGAAAEPPTFKMSEADLKTYCDSKDGEYFPPNGNKGYSCSIGQGKNAVVISCGPKGICKMYNTVVFTKPQPTHGTVFGRPAATSSDENRITAGAAQGSITMPPLKPVGPSAATASATLTVPSSKPVRSGGTATVSPSLGAAFMSSGRATLRQP
jgi:hypothetical protein